MESQGDGGLPRGHLLNQGYGPISPSLHRLGARKHPHRRQDRHSMYQCITSSIVGLANDIQAILGDALTTATTMFPHKPPAKSGMGTNPRHLWPKSVNTKSLTFGAGPSPSDASSTMKRKPKEALHRRNSQQTLLCHSGLASINRYPSTQSSTTLPRTLPLWGSFSERMPLQWTQLPYKQRTIALKG